MRMRLRWWDIISSLLSGSSSPPQVFVSILEKLFCKRMIKREWIWWENENIRMRQWYEMMRWLDDEKKRIRIMSLFCLINFMKRIRKRSLQQILPSLPQLALSPQVLTNNHREKSHHWSPNFMYWSWFSPITIEKNLIVDHQASCTGHGSNLSPQVLTNNYREKSHHWSPNVK